MTRKIDFRFKLPYLFGIVSTVLYWLGLDYLVRDEKGDLTALYSLIKLSTEANEHMYGENGENGPDRLRSYCDKILC